MKKMLRKLALAGMALSVVLAIVTTPHAAELGGRIERFTLFFGANVDSTEQASKWIPIRGAGRVVFRVFTTHAAWAANNADSTFADSIAGMRVLLSDSVSFVARDSAGTMVTASSQIPTVLGTHGTPYPVCADSFVVPITAAGDTNIKLVRVANFPINRELRAPATGSGIYMTVMPAASTTALVDDRQVFSTQYIRIRFTPLRRMTVSGFSSTQGKRVNGLKAFTMDAQVYYP